MISLIHQPSVPGGCSPPPAHTVQQPHWGWERLGSSCLMLCQALFLSKVRGPDAGASYWCSERRLHSLFGPGGVSTASPPFLLC